MCSDGIGFVWQVYENRRKLLRFFNPKLGKGRLKWTRVDGEFAIKAVRDELSFVNDDSWYYWQKAILELHAPDPAFFDPSEASWVLASFTGGFELPFSFPLQFGTIGQNLTLENKGDLPSPVVIHFRGPLKNPVLENITTGEEISIVHEIPSDETLIINTAFGQKSVEVEKPDGSRSNAFHYVSLDSTFWQLVPGENDVSYAATEESGNAAVTLSFYHRYEGV